MGRRWAIAGFVFVFMTILAAQAGTGFIRDLFNGGVYPRALRAFDWILDKVLVGPLGPTNSAIALLCFGVAFAALILRGADAVKSR
jgi:hypothetical protein